MSFYDDKTFTWELYAIADELDNCVPIPPANGIWEQIDSDTFQLTDDDFIYEADYNGTHLYMNFFIEPTNEDPEGIHIRFVFLRS